MKKKIAMITLAATIVVLTGCSGVPKEKQVKEDLVSYGGEQVLGSGESMDAIEIDARETDKKLKTDKIYFSVTTEKDGISYEKHASMIYRKDGRSWKVEDVYVNGPGEWFMTPLEGVSEETITNTISDNEIMVDDQEWPIEKGEVTSVSVVDRNTDLEAETDNVTAKIVLDGKVEKATGTVTLAYSFDDGWVLDNIKGNDDFQVELTQPLDLSEEAIKKNLDGRTVPFGVGVEDLGDGWYYQNNGTQQEITIAADELSDFVIEDQKSVEKGTIQICNCNAKWNKNGATYSLTGTISYEYNGSSWQFQSPEISIHTDSIDLMGTWTGRFERVGYREGNVVLNITSVDGTSVSGTYEYTPDEIEKYSQPGSYTVKGTIDYDSLMLNLEADTWTGDREKPDAFEMIDISLQYMAEDQVLRGKGHSSSVLVLKKQ